MIADKMLIYRSMMAIGAAKKGKSNKKSPDRHSSFYKTIHPFLKNSKKHKIFIINYLN